MSRARLISLPILLLTLSAGAAEVLFPVPLHITREISTPFSQEKTVVEEYCHGNRVVSMSGRRTAIVDHGKREVTVIDFAAGTFSITKFEEIARAREPQSRNLDAVKAQPEWRVESRGGRVVASRPGEAVEAERKSGSTRQIIRLTSDRQLALSRDAVEAILGTSYPNGHDDAADVVLRALRVQDRPIASNNAAGSAREAFFLPLEYDVSFEVEGETVETRNVVLRVGSELPPAERMAIPPGAKLVEADVLQSKRRLEELDRPAVRPVP